jgi:hypothetical protein
MWLLNVTPAVCQVVYGRPTAGNLRVTYSHWTVEDDGGKTTVSQLMIPLTGFVPLQENFDMSFYVANSSNSLETSGGDFDLNGLSNASVQANHSFNDDRVLVSVGLNLPTGKKELDLSEEYPVLGALSTNYLELPMRRFGEGFGFNVLLAGATVLGERVRGGAGIRYQYVGSYEPYEGVEDYNPGDVVALNAGMDIDGDATVWSIDFIYSFYGTDKIDDENSFKQSSQLDMRLAARHTRGTLGFDGLVRYVVRGQNEEYDEDGVELSMSPFKLYGDEFTLHGGMSKLFDNGWYAAPSIRMRLIGGNDLDFESSSVFSIGSSVGKGVGESLNIQGDLRYYTGSADGGDIDISGYQATLGLTATM